MAKPQKPSLKEEMSTSYDPEAVESYWSAWWHSNGFFTPKNEIAEGDILEKGDVLKKDQFVMMLPPPNVTGSLHLGHTLTVAIQDALSRWNRMEGRRVLWLPGLDHAGIATQSVVERNLLREENLTRHSLGREAFLEKVWQWKRLYGDRINNQLRLVGASVDWSRAAFTMDPNMSEAVTESFVRMFDAGLIYRKKRLVAWCSHLRTALSDIEVTTSEIEKPCKIKVPGFEFPVEVGSLWHFAYPLKKNKNTKIYVATTRIETMLGDTAVAVHPEDHRFKHLVGEELEHPFFKDRVIKIVADEHVDPNFGTGAVKITPAHDRNDYDMGLRHNLEAITIFTFDGKINDNGGQFAGQHRFECRHKIQIVLKEKGLLGEKVPNEKKMQLPRCSRSNDVIEYMLVPQWWVDCSAMGKRACEVVRNGELKIIPKFHEQTWFNWLGNIKDWCVSRQLWWGHRVPAYRVLGPCMEEEVWVVGRTYEEAEIRAKKKLNVEEVALEQDEDVLDTWFSSGIFPFSTLGWPRETADFATFFPNSVLETGHDILFFWVARMVMMSLTLLDKLPFHTVLLHAMVRDAHGQKMSKSKGNVIDPLEVISGTSLQQLNHKITTNSNLPQAEIKRALATQKKDFGGGIPRCGADALRMGLLAYTKQGRSVNLDISRVVGYRQFCNKLWNAVKFALLNFPPNYKITQNAPLDWTDQWILHKLNTATLQATQNFTLFQLADVVSALHHFWLYEFCDVYLELLKPRFYKGDFLREGGLETLRKCLDFGLRLLHPIIPFVSEELFHRLPDPQYTSIALTEYPSYDPQLHKPHLDDIMGHVLATAKGFRSLSSSLEIPPNQRPPGYIRCTQDSNLEEVFTEGRCSQIATLAKMGSLTFVTEEPAKCVHSIINEKAEIFLDPFGMVNFTQVVAKLDSRMAKEKHSIELLKKKMGAPDYETKVPAEVRKTNDEKLASHQEEFAGLMIAVKNVSALVV